MLDIALHAKICPWKGRSFVPCLQNKCRKAGNSLDPRGGDCNREPGSFLLNCVEPAAVGIRALFEETVAAAQSTLEGAHAGAMTGIKGKHEPVKEAPPLSCGSSKKAIHCRRQPHHPDMITKSAYGRDGCAVDPVFTLRWCIFLWLDAGPELDAACPRFEFRRNGKAAVPAIPCKVAELCLPQPASWRKER